MIVVFVIPVLTLALSTQETCRGGSVPKNKAVPPPQYPIQAAVVKNFTDTAKEKSAASTPQLLEILDTATIRKQINKTCPQLLNVSAQELMKRIVDEIAVAELMHTFSSGCNNQGDTDLPVAAAADYLYSLWQVYFLNLSRGIRLPETILNGAEIKLFRLPAFNGSKKVSGLDRFPTTFEEAGSRLIYTAMNYEKVAGPNNGFGDIMLILNRSHVNNMTVISPTDTGWYEAGHCASSDCEGYLVYDALRQPKVDGCYHELSTPVHGYSAFRHTTRNLTLFFAPNASAPPLGRWIIADNLTAHPRSYATGNGTKGPTAVAEGHWYSWYNNTSYIAETKMRVKVSNAHVYPDCKAWDHSMGTLDHLNHLIVYKYLMSWGNYSSKHIFPTINCDNVGKQTRINGWPYPYPYFEANVIGNVIYPYGVQSVVVSFTTMFGSATGDIARAWCIKNGWLLFWSYSAAATGSDLALATNARLLDPGVLVHSRAGHNYTVRQNDTVFFNRFFEDAKAIIAKTKKMPNSTQYELMWRVLTRGNITLENSKMGRPTTLTAQPLSAYQCEQPERCVGVTQYDGTCLCVS